ncbi:MAG: hypothetical protein LBI33_06275 [Propionibacteriaceae bacterium]|jgi:hypothetical protein|nr:hypothetical protein [Propionibacteriaceae bacterium]
MATFEIPIQDRYPINNAHCFGCGRLNDDGFQVKTFFDPASGTATTHYQPDGKYSGGWAQAMYGGIIACLIDCNSAATASAARTLELGETDDDPAPRFVTAELKVDLKKPTPAGAVLTLVSHVRSLEGRKVWVVTEVAYDETVTCTGEALMILTDH